MFWRQTKTGKRVVLVAFSSVAMCFVHVSFNAPDMKGKGYEAKVVIEGSATKLANELNDPEKPFGNLYRMCMKKGTIDLVCQAYSAGMEALEGVQPRGCQCAAK
jgi:hypothetical protein